MKRSISKSGLIWLDAYLNLLKFAFVSHGGEDEETSCFKRLPVSVPGSRILIHFFANSVPICSNVI